MVQRKSMLNIETMSKVDDGYTIIRLTSPKIQGHKDFDGETKLQAKKKMASPRFNKN